MVNVLPVLCTIFLTWGALVTPNDVAKNTIDLGSYITYCNIQLEKSDGYSMVVFSTDYIPKEAHDYLIKEAYKQGWYLTIEQVQGIYDWQITYKFTFTPIR